MKDVVPFPVTGDAEARLALQEHAIEQLRERILQLRQDYASRVGEPPGSLYLGHEEYRQVVVMAESSFELGPDRGQGRKYRRVFAGMEVQELVAKHHVGVGV